MIAANMITYGVKAFESFWRVVRTLAGDDSYERYCMHHGSHHAHEPLLSRRDYYIASQQKKWTGINRCC